MRRKGRGSGHDSERGDVGSGKAKWVVRTAQAHIEKLPSRAAPQPARPSNSGVAMATVYTHAFRKHDRIQFEEICNAMRTRQLVQPHALSLLGGEIPIFREVPSVELAAV